MSAKAANSQSILSDMQPSRAIVKLAIPATLALLAKAITIWWTPPTSAC